MADDDLDHAPYLEYIPVEASEKPLCGLTEGDVVAVYNGDGELIQHAIVGKVVPTVGEPEGTFTVSLIPDPEEAP